MSVDFDSLIQEAQHDLYSSEFHPTLGPSGSAAPNPSNRNKLSKLESVSLNVAELYVTRCILGGIGERLQMLQQVEPELFRMGAIPGPFSISPAIPPDAMTSYKRLVVPESKNLSVSTQAASAVYNQASRAGEALASGLENWAMRLQSYVFSQEAEPIVANSSAPPVVADMTDSLRSATQEKLKDFLQDNQGSINNLADSLRNNTRRFVNWVSRNSNRFVEEAEKNRQETAELLAKSGKIELLPDGQALSEFERSSVFDVVAWRARMNVLETLPNSAASASPSFPLLGQIENALSAITGGLALRESWLNLGCWITEIAAFDIFRRKQPLYLPESAEQWSTWKRLQAKWTHELPSTLASTFASMPFRHALLFVNTIPNATLSQWLQLISRHPLGLWSTFCETPIIMLERYIAEFVQMQLAVSSRRMLKLSLQKAWRDYAVYFFESVIQAASGEPVLSATHSDTPTNVDSASLDESDRIRSRATKSVYCEWKSKFEDALKGSPSLADEHIPRPEVNCIMYYRPDKEEDFKWLIWHVFSIFYWRRNADNSVMRQDPTDLALLRNFALLPSVMVSSYVSLCQGREDQDCLSVYQIFQLPSLNTEIIPPSNLPPLSIFDPLPSLVSDELNKRVEGMEANERDGDQTATVEQKGEEKHSVSSDSSSSFGTLVSLIPVRFLNLICSLAIATADRNIFPEAIAVGERLLRIHAELTARPWGAQWASTVLQSTKQLHVQPPYLCDQGENKSMKTFSRKARRWLLRRALAYFDTINERFTLLLAGEAASYPLRTLRYRVSIGFGFPRALSYSSYLGAAYAIFKNEGFTAFYAGFTTIAERSALTSLASLVMKYARLGYSKARNALID